MPDIIRFTDPDNDASVRKDVSSLVLLDPAPDWGEPDEDNDRRVISLTFILSGANKAALISEWQAIAEQIEKASSLEVRLEGASNSVWFDQKVRAFDRPNASDEDRSAIKSLYDWRDGRLTHMRAETRLVCFPYARGAEATLANAAGIASAPNASNFVDLTGIIGDVPAPALVELVFDTMPNRLIARFYRRSQGTVANFQSIYEAESATLTNNTASQAEGSASNGNSTRTTPANQNLNKTHAWSLSGNMGDKRGTFDVYVKIRDGDSTPGRIKARVDLLGSDSQLLERADTTTITADADHDAHVSYELWRLGSIHIAPDYDGTPGARTIELFLQRTSGTATIDVDYLLLVPIDESVAIIDFTADVDSTASSSKTFAFDSDKQRAWRGTLTGDRLGLAQLLGGGIYVRPGFTNRLIVQASADTHSGAGATVDKPPSIDVDGLASITVKYRPRYHFVR